MPESSAPVLKKGTYLAPVSRTHELGSFLVGMTEYPEAAETGLWHAHEKPFISFVLEGGNVEHRRSGRLERRAGSINFYHSYEPHQNLYKVFPSRHFSIEIEHSFLEENGFDENRLARTVRDNPSAKFLFLKILKEVILNTGIKRQAAEMLILDLLASVPAKAPSSGSPSWATLLKTYLNDNWHRWPSLEELSGAAGVHPVTISGNFRQYFGCTFGEYMRKLKVDRALPLIRNSRRPLTRVAFDCGFSDQSHFCRTFKRQTGFLPGQFREL